LLLGSFSQRAYIGSVKSIDNSSARAGALANSLIGSAPLHQNKGADMHARITLLLPLTTAANTPLRLQFKECNLLM
jgi:hypothetical protein